MGAAAVADAVDMDLADLQQAKEAAAAAAPAVAEDMRKEIEALKKTSEEQQRTIEALQADIARLKAQCAGAATAAAEGGDAPEGAKEKKVVSEYAKWMENAGSTPGAIEGEEPPAEDDLSDPDDDLGEGAFEAQKPVVAKPGDGKAPPASTEVAAAEGKVKEHKSKSEQLKKKLERLNDDAYLGYASLLDKCIEKHDGQYTYKLCFYDRASQDHVSLGNWKRFAGARLAEFTDGQMCPGGPARMLRVVFQCGGEDAVLDVSEPSRCVYEAHVSSPGACDADDAAALEKPPSKHPKDEL
uniref:MRH domain-containing protein n=1 Tax=Zooxanthella nutricula TaxID=1333877 RepID=A0A7S2PVU0_9DINO